MSHGSSFNSHKRPMSALILLFYFTEKKTKAQKEVPQGLRYGDLGFVSCVWRAVSKMNASSHYRTPAIHRTRASHWDPQPSAQL